MEVRLLYVRHFPMYLTLKTTDENSMQIFGQFSVLLQAIMGERERERDISRERGQRVRMGRKGTMRETGKGKRLS